MLNSNRPGFRPDVTKEWIPVGKTDVYIPGSDKPVQLVLDHILSVEPIVAAPGMGGLSTDGEYVPSFEGDDPTLQQHLDKVNELTLFGDLE